MKKGSFHLEKILKKGLFLEQDIEASSLYLKAKEGKGKHAPSFIIFFFGIQYTENNEIEIHMCMFAPSSIRKYPHSFWGVFYCFSNETSVNFQYMIINYKICI